MSSLTSVSGSIDVYILPLLVRFLVSFEAFTQPLWTESPEGERRWRRRRSVHVNLTQTSDSARVHQLNDVIRQGRTE